MNPTSRNSSLRNVTPTTNTQQAQQLNTEQNTMTAPQILQRPPVERSNCFPKTSTDSQIPPTLTSCLFEKFRCPLSKQNLIRLNTEVIHSFANKSKSLDFYDHNMDLHLWKTLIRFAQENESEHIKFLLRLRKDPDKLASIKDANGMTVLMHAALSNISNSIKALLHGVSNPNALASLKNEKKQNALMIAVIENHPESIKALLCGVSNPDALAGTENENGMSTLMLAAEKSNAESIQALLDHIKHPENLIYFSNHHGRTALMYCTLNKNIHQSKNNIISIILEKATKVRDISYRMSPKYKNGENAYISIDRDALIFLHDRDGMNAFMHAASQNNNFAVETLFNWTINKLALLKEKNEKNQSALDLLDKRSCSSLIENLQKIKIADDSPDLDLNAALTLLKERNVQF